MQEDTPAYEESGGKVFQDLGLPNAEEERLRARLTLRIYRAIRERGLVQVAPLLRLLAALGQGVAITVRPAPAARGRGAGRPGRCRVMPAHPLLTRTERKLKPVDRFVAEAGIDYW